ncbi:YesL family protein [Gracilibacillus phocaeensis]|uniref:YesL family protein n=1 Tax=Gracilibacillus phocaeensis TaxID=2042304 RepID=UPI0010313768|nr:DUF624 domain-containing protein [Gracilibacillus phocaeensis]
MRNKLFGLTEWITRLAYINMLWIGFTLLGLIIFGLFPATIAMFSLTRQWIMGNTDIPVFSTFWKTYKKEFLKGNLLGLIFYAIGFVFFVNTSFLLNVDAGSFFNTIKIPLYVAMIALALIMIYVIPTYVHYDLKFLQMWKNAFLIMLIHPLHNIALLVGSAAAIFIMFRFPATLVFFSGSAVALIIMSTCYQAFKRVAMKQEQWAEKEAETTAQ